MHRALLSRIGDDETTVEALWKAVWEVPPDAIRLLFGDDDTCHWNDAMMVQISSFLIPIGHQSSSPAAELQLQICIKRDVSPLPLYIGLMNQLSRHDLWYFLQAPHTGVGEVLVLTLMNV